MISLIRKVSAFAAYLALASFSSLCAQPALGSGAVRAEVAFFAVAGAPDSKDSFVFSGPKKTQVPTPIQGLQKPAYVAYEGPPSLSLYSPGGTNGSPVQLASVILPPSPKVLVLLAPGRQSAAGAMAGYAAVAIEDDAKNFPIGSVRFVNYSGKRAQLRAQGRVVELAKGPSTPILISEPGKPAADFPIEVFTVEEEGPSIAYQTKLRLQLGQRLNVLILPSRRVDKRGVSVTLLSDRIASSAVEKASR